MTHDDDTCPHLVRANLLEAENARLKAEVERLRITEQNQTDRVISLEDCIQVLKQDRDGLIYEESEQVKRLNAEVERLTAIVDADAIDREHGMCCDSSAQVERLTKAGDAMVKLP